MFRLTIVLALVIICYGVSHAFGSPTVQGSTPGSQGQGSNLKKTRILNPVAAAGRAYRLLRNAANAGADEDDLFVDDDSPRKRNNFDDYGHMRFGKRQTGGQDFDDYGHMRFGKRQGGQTDDYGIGLRFGK